MTNEQWAFCAGMATGASVYIAGMITGAFLLYRYIATLSRLDQEVRKRQHEEFARQMKNFSSARQNKGPST